MNEVSMAFVSHGDIYDREHHEDIGLERHDQDMEDGPAYAEYGAKYGSHQSGGRPQPEQEENDFACVHVSVESQGM